MSTNTEKFNDTDLKLALRVLDLTNLEEDCNEKDIEDLCKRAVTKYGNVAAICIWPAFISLARQELTSATPIKIATVVNFPSGDQTKEAVLTETASAIAAGADEIDLVLPWKKLLNDQSSIATQLVQQVRKLMPTKTTLKVILETGELKTEKLVAEASHIAIDAGANFIKTSTGKVPINATPEATRVMLEVISSTGSDTGFKAAGGIRSCDDAINYLNLAASIMGKKWISEIHFRFGASGLLDQLLQQLSGSPTSGKSKSEQADQNSY